MIAFRLAVAFALVSVSTASAEILTTQPAAPTSADVIQATVRLQVPGVVLFVAAGLLTLRRA